MPAAAPVADPAAIAAVQDILKEVWTSDALEDQLLNDTVLFDWIDDVTEYTDSNGLKAVVPLRTGRTAGISSRPIGGTLGAAGHQSIDRAEYEYTYHYLTIKVLGPVVARMKSNRQACVREIDFEVQNGLDDFKQDQQRQLYGDGTGAIATVAVSTTSNTVTIPATDLVGRHALTVGWLYEGQRIVIGTVANPWASMGGFSAPSGHVTIATINADAGTFTLANAETLSCTAGHFIFLHGNVAANVSYEMNGLRNIVSDSATLGTLNPATATFWKAIRSHNSGTLRANSVDLMMRTENAIRRKGGRTEVILGDLEQERRYYNLLTPAVRYAGDKKLSGGNKDGLDFHGKEFVGDAHCIPNKLYFLNRKALQSYSAGAIGWQNQTTGGDILAWVQNEDAFVARAAKYHNVGTNRRNTLGVLDDLDGS